MPHVERQVDDRRVGDGVLVLAPLGTDWVREGDVVVMDADANADHLLLELDGGCLAHQVRVAAAAPPVRDVREHVGLDVVLVALHPLDGLGHDEFACLGVMLEEAAKHLAHRELRRILLELFQVIGVGHRLDVRQLQRLDQVRVAPLLRLVRDQHLPGFVENVTHDARGLPDGGGAGASLDYRVEHHVDPCQRSGMKSIAAGRVHESLVPEIGVVNVDATRKLQLEVAVDLIAGRRGARARRRWLLRLDLEARGL